METIATSTSSEYSLVDGNAASLDSLSEIDADNTILEISYSLFDTQSTSAFLYVHSGFGNIFF